MSRLDEVHQNSFQDVPIKMAKADLKKVQEAKGRAKWGAILRRAIELAGLIEKEAADQIDVGRSQLSAWLNGTENAHTWKFHAHELLGPAMLAAQAEETEGATIRTVIELRRKVG